MNQGSLLLDKNFFNIMSLKGEFQKIENQDWRPTWADLSYADKSWRTVPLIVKGKKTEHYGRFSHLDEITEKFKTSIIDMMFYSLLPGGTLHPHRDMVGAVGLGCLRFHIPIQTNDMVNFRVDGKRVVMNPGELWALDTSYKHSVANLGLEERVHLVLDVQVNDWVKGLIPAPGLPYYLHQGALVSLAVIKAIRTVVMEPSRLKANFKLAKYVGSLLVTKVNRFLRQP